MTWHHELPDLADLPASREPWSEDYRARCRKRVSALLKDGEDVTFELEGDIFLKEHDGYFGWHTYGLLVATDRRTFLVSSPRSGRWRLDQTSTVVREAPRTSTFCLEDWRSLFSIGPAVFRISDQS